MFTTKKDPSSITQVHETVAKEVKIWEKVFAVEEVFSMTLAGAPAIVIPQLRLVQAQELPRYHSSKVMKRP